MTLILLFVFSATHLLCTTPDSLHASNDSILHASPVATWRLLEHIPLQTPEGGRPHGVAIPMKDRDHGRYVFLQRLNSKYFSQKKQATVIACAADKNEDGGVAQIYILVENTPLADNIYSVRVSAVQPQGITTLIDTRNITPNRTAVSPLLIHTNPHDDTETLNFYLTLDQNPWILQISTSRQDFLNLKISGTPNTLSWRLDKNFGLQCCHTLAPKPFPQGHVPLIARDSAMLTPDQP